ncbi:ATP-NAD kinase family protein [Veronia pacifica]|uniref:ATP-NAD kinase family protein n=1 Tax=Veronia pacifica TaxID=1080227 RepID=UPI000B14BE8C|nr:NAD(+)/NADH kinase [Veronia pacifica]
MATPLVGIIANPVSARDIRRVIARATNLQITDRANIVLRILAGLAEGGVPRVVMMPERAGIEVYIQRGLEQAARYQSTRFPAVSWLNMQVTGEAQDTFNAMKQMAEMNVDLVVVLGGDGTHRLVVKASRDIPIVGVSTGTNNAFPPRHEATITGLAAGLAASNQIPASCALSANKLLEVAINDHKDIALVDAAVVKEQYTGAKAVWRTESLRELFVTFGQPDSIGISAIAGLLNPVSREEPEGRHIILHQDLHSKDKDDSFITAPIAPGLFSTLPVQRHQPLQPFIVTPVTSSQGSLALDGEREWQFGRNDKVNVTLITNAFHTVNVSACMQFAVSNGLFTARRHRDNAPTQ